MDELVRAAEAAAQGDAVAAVRALLAAWQRTRAPEIAAALERVTAAALQAEPDGWERTAEREDVVEAARLVDRLREVNAAGATARVAALGWLRDDPRVAAAALRIVADPTWQATAARPFWTRLFALLDRNADPRALEALAALPDEIDRLIRGEVMRQWYRKKVQASAAALAALAAPVELNEAEARIVRRIELSPGVGRAAPGRPATTATATATDLLSVVYDAPDDDGARAVLADFYTERGDPRGEFITLQLRRRDRRDPGREGKLLVKHQAAWLGELAPVVRYKSSLIYGPELAPWGMHVHGRWHRGFLAGANLELGGAKLKKLASLPAWATIEHAIGLQATGRDDAALATLLRSMRGLRSLAGHLPLLRIAAGVDALRARLEHVNAWLRDEDVAPTLDLLAAMPRLRRLEVDYTANVEPLLASPVWPRLETLRLGSGSSLALEVRRAGGEVHITVGCGAGAPTSYVRAVLAAVPAGEVASFTVRGYSDHAAFAALGGAFPRVTAPIIEDLSA